MTTKAELEAAAFWDGKVCLDCGTVQTEEDDGPCEGCGSARLIPCQDAIDAAALLEED